MESAEVFSICHDALNTLIVTAAPAMMVALGVGLVISLIQALTQIQETTLTFVPKILAVFITLAFTMSFILNQLSDLNSRMHEKIVNIE
jgi:flagellar biosynthetic protein FliQ